MAAFSEPEIPGYRSSRSRRNVLSRTIILEYKGFEEGGGLAPPLLPLIGQEVTPSRVEGMIAKNCMLGGSMEKEGR